MIRVLRDAWLFSRMMTWRAVLPVLKRRVRIATLAKVMWCEPNGRREETDPCRVVDFARRLYWRPRARRTDICLERSLLAYRYLSQAGSAPLLVIGIRRPGSSVIGHAWVVMDGEPLYESAAEVGEYASLFSFGQGGALVESLSGRPRAGDARAG